MKYVTIDHSRESGPIIYAFDNEVEAYEYFEHELNKKNINGINRRKDNPNIAFVNGWDIRILDYDELTPFQRKMVDENSL